ncbi:MAG: hypothetical protein XD77_0548, partial [Marinimicrobia bacterium 46_47]
YGLVENKPHCFKLGKRESDYRHRHKKVTAYHKIRQKDIQMYHPDPFPWL